MLLPSRARLSAPPWLRVAAPAVGVTGLVAAVLGFSSAALGWRAAETYAAYQGRGSAEYAGAVEWWQISAWVTGAGAVMLVLGLVARLIWRL